jgi:hypothetical protein
MNQDNNSLFGNLDDFTIQNQEWKDMPEFVQENLKPWKTIEVTFDDYFATNGKLVHNRVLKVHFENYENIKEFVSLFGFVGVTHETKYLKYNSIDKFKLLIKQNLTDNTQSIWHPELTEVSYMDKRWTSSSPLNPQYPVYIISKGRWETRLTSKALELINVPYSIVIEPQEYDNYAKVIDPKKILVLPFSNLGLGSIPARNWVWEHSIQLGAKRHWILDDNLNSFVRCNKNLKVWVTDGTIFKCAEDFVDRYENVGISGLNYWMFVPRKEQMPCFYLNTRIYSCILIQNDIPYRWRGRYNEDTDLSIRALKDGWCTILFNAFICDKEQTMTMKGGNTEELYKPSTNKEEDGRWKMAQSLVEQHPDIVKIAWKWDRWQHQVDYSGFKRNKLTKKLNLNIPDRVNEYGMELKKVNEVNNVPL